MAQLKAHEVDGWLKRPDPTINIILLYGPDRGLVSERARQLAERTGVPLDDPFSVVRLDAGEIDKDSSLLDEASAVSMFSARRLLWVRNAQAQKPLADDVKLLCANPPSDAIVLIEAGDLKKGVALRASIEGGKTAIALPCYSDDSRSIDAVIDDELRKAGKSIDADARAALRRNLGGDRLATRGELAKLILYTLDQTSIHLDDVKALTGDVSSVSADEVVDAILDGNVDAFDQSFAKTVTTASQTYAVLSALQRQLQFLQLMRSSMESEGKNASTAVAGARPPVFFTRKKLVEKALERWSTRLLAQFLAQIHEIILQTRRHPDLAVAATHRVLMQITLRARS